MSEIPEIRKEEDIRKKIHNTFKAETKEYDDRYMFFNSIEEFEKSLKFISVNGYAFRQREITTAKEHARKNLYKIPGGQFVLISHGAWKKMGYDFPPIISKSIELKN